MSIDRWVAAILAPLAIWVLLNALDDLVLDVACFYRWLSSYFSRRKRWVWPTDAELADLPQRRMAIFVPLWKEHRVIQNMVEHNITSQLYENYDFFIGAYPNDGPTLAAIREVTRRFPNVHMAVCPHDGPTSKADCLNWIYQRMLLYEEENDARFEMILTHDAEDLIHPEALRWINFYAQWNDMVQIPVLALPTKWTELTHGVYCDEFAEFQFKDMPVRQMLGGFVPSNGVGTGFSREGLERLAAAHSNRIFEPECLTEDYENGYRMYKLKCPQVFMPVHWNNGSFVATREYFPRTFRAAVKQRTRWVTGIALQSWERHGFRETLSQLYWFWRDRKCLAGNIVTPLTNLIFVYGALTCLASWLNGTPWGLAERAQNLLWVYVAILGLQAFHIGVRAWFCSRVYGWRFASGVPVRVIWGNWINCLATVSAMYRFFNAKIHGRPLVWLKTEHAYPNRAALMENRRSLAEVLVSSQYVTAEELEEALASKPPNRRLGEHLMKSGKLTETDLYEALSLWQNLPLGKPEAESVSRPVTRSFPAEVSKRWQVLPFRVAAGHLYVVGTDVPSDKMNLEVKQFSSLELRFHLVTPTDFAELAAEYLP